MSVPIIDIAPFLLSSSPSDRESVIKQWSQAFENYGFAVIVGHGIGEELQNSLYNAGMEFFDEPLAEKLKSTHPGPQNSQGYVGQGIESVAKTAGKPEAPPDLVENISFTYVDWENKLLTNDLDRSIYRANLWPQRPAALEPLVRKYYAEVQNLTRRLMSLSALALDLAEDFFDPYYDRMATILRLAHYPDQPDEPLDGQMRYGAHTDDMGLTVLRQDRALGGLQVQLPSSEWQDVKPIQNSLVINSGDLIGRWTNDRWKSTMHRVTNPPRNLTGSTRRLSIVYFTGPNYDAMCSCLPSCLSGGQSPSHAPVRCFDHLMQKIRSSMPETSVAATY